MRLRREVSIGTHTKVIDITVPMPIPIVIPWKKSNVDGFSVISIPSMPMIIKEQKIFNKVQSVRMA